MVGTAGKPLKRVNSTSSGMGVERRTVGLATDEHR